MRQLLMVTWVIWILCVSQQANAADQAQQAEAAENKAKVLEQDAATGTTRAPAAPSETITKPETQALDPVGDKPLDDAITCLARTIYWEAKGEDAASMEAVANVVMNRLGRDGFPKTVCEVVKEGHERGACQFSWWCDGREDDAEEEKSYSIAKEIARKALNRQLTDRTGGALYFHQGPATTEWSREYIKTTEVGKFSFYKPHNGAAK
jgi:spore germination cell wall hydrolase CwlJ-like protein